MPTTPEKSTGTPPVLLQPAGTVVRAEDCRGLTVLRDRLGSSFIGGVVLHTGEPAYQLADRLFAVPIDQLWTPFESAHSARTPAMD